MEYEIKGTGSQTVVFDAGALSGMGGWDAIWPALPDNITAIRFSRRGEGASSACVGQHSISEYVEDVEVLLSKLDVRRPFVYVSHSLGGAISRAYAVRNPGLIAGMLLVDPSNPRDVEIITTVDPKNGFAELQRIKEQDYESGSDQWCFLDAIWDKSKSPGYAEIGDVPVTLIAGVKRVESPQQIFDSDEARRLWGVYQSEWVDAFPRGRAVVTNRSGHFVQDDEPELVITELEKLIAEVTASGIND